METTLFYRIKLIHPFPFPLLSLPVFPKDDIDAVRNV